MASIKILKTCSRGHKYKHSSDCPVCPICWPGYYKKNGSRYFDMLTVSSKAPSFEAQDQDGKVHKLSDYLGKWVVLYFYPRDNTPGCTKEACNFRDSYSQLQKMGVVILGVSRDSIESHKKFAQKYSLNFPLLADTEKMILKSYNAWGIKKFMGREFEGIKRMTYLINPKGKIAKIYEKVNPVKHTEEIISDLESLT